MSNVWLPWLTARAWRDRYLTVSLVSYCRTNLNYSRVSEPVTSTHAHTTQSFYCTSRGTCSRRSLKQTDARNVVEACGCLVVNGRRLDSAFNDVEWRQWRWLVETTRWRRDVTPRSSTINHRRPASSARPSTARHGGCVQVASVHPASSVLQCFPPVCSLMVARCLRHCNHCNNAIPDGRLTCVTRRRATGQCHVTDQSCKSTTTTTMMMMTMTTWLQQLIYTVITQHHIRYSILTILR